MALDEQANPLVEPVKSALPSSKVVRSRASKWVSLCVACGATVAVVAAGRARVTSWSPAALDSFVVPGSKVGSPGAYAVAAPNVHDSSTTAFTVWNKYIMRDGPLGTDYPWMDGVLVEPYRATYFEAPTQSESAKWSVWPAGKIKTNAYNYKGRGFQHTFETTGTFLVEMKADGVVTQGRIFVKYVRREVRSLFVEDRSKFFEAYRSLWLVTTDEGRRLYDSPKYKGIDYFVRLHLVDAGAYSCDGFHDGAGFLNSHVAINVELEQALQAVDPSVSLAYWDYTIEAARVTRTGNLSSWRESEIFQPDVLGTMRPLNILNIIDDGGHWDHLPMLQDPKHEYTSYTNAYGLMRSAWNCLKTPFLVRSKESYGYTTNHYPTCQDVHNAMKLDMWYNGTSDCNGTEGCGSAQLDKMFALQVMYDPHGTVHNMIGGMWGIDAAEYVSTEYFMSPNGHIDTYTLFQELNPKGSWMSDLIECPTVCSMDVEQADCACECTDDSIEIKRKMLAGEDRSQAYEYLERKGALDWLHTKSMGSAARNLLHVKAHKKNGPYLPDGSRRVHFADGRSIPDADEVFAALSTQICDAGFLGTMMDSGAPLDPIFYLTHASVERYWQWKQLSPHPYEKTWVDGSSYTDCLKPAHNYNDTRLWKNLVDSNDHYYTNGELAAIFDPNVNTLDYTYDAFEWKICDEQGYPVRKFWETD